MIILQISLFDMHIITSLTHVLKYFSIFHFLLIEEEEKAYALPVVGMGPPWPSIEHGHSGITAHLETMTLQPTVR